MTPELTAQIRSKIQEIVEATRNSQTPKTEDELIKEWEQIANGDAIKKFGPDRVGVEALRVLRGRNSKILVSKVQTKNYTVLIVDTHGIRKQEVNRKGGDGVEEVDVGSAFAIVKTEEKGIIKNTPSKVTFWRDEVKTLQTLIRGHVYTADLSIGKDVDSYNSGGGWKDTGETRDLTKIISLPGFKRKQDGISYDQCVSPGDKTVWCIEGTIVSRYIGDRDGRKYCYMTVQPEDDAFGKHISVSIDPDMARWADESLVFIIGMWDTSKRGLYVQCLAIIPTDRATPMTAPQVKQELSESVGGQDVLGQVGGGETPPDAFI